MGEQDRISMLGDGVLGHILSFLPSSKESARAAALSTRWRDAYAAVHSVLLVEPEGPVPSYDRVDGYRSRKYRSSDEAVPRLPFTAVVTAALFARHSAAAAAPRPLRALRVALEGYSRGDSRAVDRWVSYAVRWAAVTGLELDLRLRCRAPVCSRPYSLRPMGRGGGGGSCCAVSRPEEQQDESHRSGEEDDRRAKSISDGHSEQDDDDVSEAISEEYCAGEQDDDDAREAVEDDSGEHDGDATSDEEDDVVSSVDEEAPRLWPWELPRPEYNVLRGLFSCPALRALRIGPCRLSPPATISLPSLEELLLTHVSDEGAELQRLFSACPRLADLTLEACHTVTALSLLDNTRLRRLALRCCHKLAGVAIGGSELHVFEYRGAVPDASFLTMPGIDSWPTSIASCKVDICGEEAKFGDFLRLFAHTERLQVQSARLGSGMDKDAFASLPEFRSLRHLEMRGYLPRDDAAAIVGAMSRMLQHAPNLEVLTLIFQTEPEREGDEWLPGGRYGCKERELHGVHHLEHYNPFDFLDAPPSAVIPCLADRVREINLVHYQGGRAQRTLAKFLLCNAPLLDQLYCGFAPGPLWIQAELRSEIEGWAMNKPENRIFY